MLQADTSDPVFGKKLIDAKAYLQTVGTKNGDSL
jgi:hypothetical protein